ncbi:hypothetical protein V8G54_014976 [Vigna mungo]|uniref:Uncharacterized protein n=1 Tax=Vigna mungo TaxID=3915 RepID=A0AAQ3NK28_VIGMU
MWHADTSRWDNFKCIGDAANRGEICKIRVLGWVRGACSCGCSSTMSKEHYLMMVLAVARASAEVWECIAEPPSSDQILDLVCCFPLHQLTLCLHSLFCAPHFNYSYLTSDSDEDDDGSSRFDYYYQSYSNSTQ